ncbi:MULTISPECIES: calcium/sodium antiporter [Oceanimonas]|uniref:Calcium/sodium antiporter n=1 Tax=Oceanimonas doudoroffii TaxID=84158 RepID=A0A233REU3_9GAMM|nr:MULTISPECIES: calcium/sodium antiporter [Oceanimonas]NHI01428.1 Inner membrane protein YrbG [Oceanimonas sp. MB9]OXY81910.1 calcium/sodium antiporter [Oceanimonas doudoroffii]
MLMSVAAILLGLAVLVWSADRFVDGASATARHAGMPPLLIGMVIVGFGTSAPEIVVSIISALEGNPGLALGNAYGSNIANIGLILGITALISPIAVHSQVLRKELPILLLITLLSLSLLWNGWLARTDAIMLLVVFVLLMAWSIRQGLRDGNDSMAAEQERELDDNLMSLKKALFWLLAGLVLLIISSRILVWGAVNVAQAFGVSDLIIGLTIVAIGTSLPELASSIAAIRKNEHDLALGNVIGSNLFNTLAVVGLAGIIHPLEVMPEVLSRDFMVMIVLTLSLFVLGFGFKGRQGRINRFEGAFLLTVYVAYTGWLAGNVIAAA